MSEDDLSKCMQDVVQLDSCLLPLGLQQADSTTRNIVARFNADSEYITSSWIDLESIRPVQGDKETTRKLEKHLDILLAQQNSYKRNQFRLHLSTLKPHLAFVRPDPGQESQLRYAFQHAIEGFFSGARLEVVVRFCFSEWLNPRMYRLFPKDLLTTLLYWTLMQSACKAFADKPQLVTVYLQLLRYAIEYHMRAYGMVCYCWIRETVNSMSNLHDTLAPCVNLKWECVAERIVMPLTRCVSRIQQAKIKSNGSPSPDGETNSLCLLGSSRTLDLSSDPTPKCSSYAESVFEDSVLTDDCASLCRNLDSLVSATIRDTSVADALLSCEHYYDVVDFLMDATRLLQSSAPFFKPFEILSPSTSRNDFVVWIKSVTQNDPALELWRAKVLPALL